MPTAEITVVTVREAGRLLKPTRPLGPRRVRQLLAEAGFQLVPLSVPSNRRVKVGVRAQDVDALVRAREETRAAP